MASNAMKLAFVTILVGIIVGTSNAATYTIGDKTGWTIPPSATFYTNWVSKQSFKVGDVLVFNFPVGAHTVAEVSKTAYDSCTTNNLLSAVKSTAPANYTLSSGGTHYFICTITGHCSAGQKLSIPVSATATAPTTAPATKKTPSPAPVSTPASAPSPATSAAATTPAPSPAKSTGGSPTPAPAASTSPAPSPAKSTGGSPSPAPATGTTASPPSPVGPSPTAGSVPTPASGPSGGAAASGPTGESTPPPSAATAVGGFGLLSLFSVVVLALF